MFLGIIKAKHGKIHGEIKFTDIENIPAQGYKYRNNLHLPFPNTGIPDEVLYKNPRDRQC